MKRLWLALAAVAALLVGAALVAAVSSAPGVALDPRSAHPDGSKALARVLTGYGAGVRRVATVAAATQSTGAAVLVTSPDDYSSGALRRLRSASRLLVLVAPGPRALDAVLPGADVDAAAVPDPQPGCADPGARAAGPLDVPAEPTLYRYPGSCYGGLVVVTQRVAVLGSADLLRNDHLDGDGVAALDVNTLTAGRSPAQVTWLLPGPDATGPATTSVWQLFPPAARRAFWWLLAVGVLLAAWRARRLGAVLREPLPVVVRAAEAVEGHGRLYHRAGARDRAAAALQQGATVRLAARLGLPRGTTAERVAQAAAPLTDLPPLQLAGLLAGPPPADDAALVALARDLDAVRAEVDGRISR